MISTKLNIQVKMSGIVSDLSIRFPLEDTSTPIQYLLLEYLDELGKVIADVTEVAFMIKTDPMDLDVDAVYSKVLADTEITIDLTTSIVDVLISDFTGLVVGTKFYIALGIKFSGDASFREVPAVKKFIQFKQDVIRA